MARTLRLQPNDKILEEKGNPMNRIATTILISLVMIPGASLWAQSNPDDNAAPQSSEKVPEAARKSLQRRGENTGIAIRVPQPGTAFPVVNLPKLASAIPLRGDLFGFAETPLASLQIAPGTWWNRNENAAAIGLTKEQ